MATAVRRPIAQQIFEIPATWHDRKLYSTADSCLTYSEVRQRMLAAAGWLQQAHAVGPGHRIALCLPRNLETICLIYGVLAAGASFVPLQFNGPLDRINAQLASIQPRLLLTTSAMERKLGGQHGGGSLPPTVCIDGPRDRDAWEQLVHGADPVSRPLPVDPSSLAAIHFTSGSTGEPKGIMLSHAGMSGTVSAFSAGDHIRRDDRLIGQIALHYNSSLQIFYPMLSGACMHLLSDDDAMFPDLVAAALRKERITLWTSTATALRLLVEEASRGDMQFEEMRFVRFFGERMPMAALRAAMHIMPNAIFENVYGASEAFSIMTYRVPRPLPAQIDLLPLGRPTGIYRLCLCDADGRPVPDGESGEICVTGDIVMMGYWNEPALTESRRLPGTINSFRTGDLARLGDDGNYCLVGRADHQVKLRGHRFDLGEIEAALKSHPQVRDAIAVVPGEGAWNGRVIAAVLADRDAVPVRQLTAQCASRLPPFARPAAIVVLDRFPLLPSGKIDRLALAAVAEHLLRGGTAETGG